MYNSPIPRHAESTSRLTPLQVLLEKRLTKENVDRLGWLNWDTVSKTLDDYLEFPESPADGGLDRRARRLLYVLSFVVIQERFGVPSLVPCAM